MIKELLIFAAGAAVGAGITYRILDTKYKNLVNEEVDEMRDYFKNRYTKEKETEVVTENDEYVEVASKYTSNNESKPELEDEDDDSIFIYVIEPDEYGEIDDYDEESLTLYSDGVLTDDRGFVIEDVAGTVGDHLKEMGKYESDALHIRNEIKEADYEILAVDDKYMDKVEG